MVSKMSKIILVVASAFFSSHISAANAANVTGESSLISVGYLPVNQFENLVYDDNPDLFCYNENPWTIGLYLATRTFGHPSEMKGNPVQMALAIAALDALAGQLYTGVLNRYSIHAFSAMEMLQARERVRSVLGIAATTPSQSVIDHLLLVAEALQNGDQTAALQALRAPEFTNSPEQTLGILSNFPFIRIANDATMDFSVAVDQSS